MSQFISSIRTGTGDVLIGNLFVCKPHLNGGKGLSLVWCVLSSQKSVWCVRWVKGNTRFSKTNSCTLFISFIYFFYLCIDLFKKKQKKKHLDFGQQDLSQDRIREKAFNWSMQRYIFFYKNCVHKLLFELGKWFRSVVSNLGVCTSVNLKLTTCWLTG